MYEVYLRLQFDSACLGSCRNDVEGGPDKMLHSADGSVVFSQTWWRTIVTQGAIAMGRHQERVKAVLWTPSVDGTTKIFRRYYNLRGDKGCTQKMFKDHEAFLAGDIIGVKALVPDDIPLEDFRDIMSMAGEYFGISPFGWKMGYGKFRLIEAGKTRAEAGYVNIVPPKPVVNTLVSDKVANVSSESEAPDISLAVTKPTLSEIERMQKDIARLEKEKQHEDGITIDQGQSSGSDAN